MISKVKLGRASLVAFGERVEMLSIPVDLDLPVFNGDYIYMKFKRPSQVLFFLLFGYQLNNKETRIRKERIQCQDF